MSTNNSVLETQKQNMLIPLLITTVFGIISSYIMIFHHTFWFEFDGILYFETGVQILNGDGINVKQNDTPIGGPVIYALIDLVINNSFLTMKLISIFSCTAIVFFSYFIAKNIFDQRIALLTQLLVAINAQILWLATHLMNDAFPFMLITASLYFITKKNIKTTDLIIIGGLLGIASMIRAQAIPVSLAIFIYLIIQKNKIKIKIKNLSIFGIIFLIFFSPLLIYNYNTHDVLSDSNPNFALTFADGQTPELHKQLENVVLEEKPFNPFLDLEFFLKNYVNNLLFVNPSILFNFFVSDNLSPIPIIPFLGMIPILGGMLYCSNFDMTKTKKIIILIVFLISLSLISIIDLNKYFFAILIFPILSLGIMQIKKFKENLLPILILPVVFFLIISIVALGRGYQMFPILITSSILSSVFLIEFFPKIISKISKRNNKNIISKITIATIVLVIIINVGYSYKVSQYSLYENVEISDIKSEIFNILRQDELKQRGWEYKVIGDILSKEDDIENSYIISDHNAYSYYSGAKYLHTQFHEGKEGNSLNEFVMRDEWSEYDRFISNLHSIPMDRQDIFQPQPDYLVFEPQNYHIEFMETNRALELHQILSNPNHPMIPDNFKVLYQSKESGKILYKINYDHLQ